MGECSRTRILISGTSSGFGRLTALELVRRGHTVFAGIRDAGGRRAAAAQALVEAAQGAPGALTVLDLDVTSDALVDAAAAAANEGGPLDVLVNNAGVAAGGVTESFTPEDLRRLFEVNVLGVQRMFRAVLPGMRAAGAGLIVTVSSTLGREVTPFLGGYCASKFALEALLEDYRYELGMLGIDCVTVQPGTFPTTDIVPNLLQPSDPGRAGGYGPLLPLLEGFFAGLGAYAQSGQAPSPQLVADAIADLVATPHGARPRRVVIDPNGPGGASRLNAASDEVQEKVLSALGLTALAPRR